MALFWLLCTHQYSRWGPPYNVKFFFLAFLSFFSLPAFSEQFYEYFARSQKIPHQQLQTSVNNKISSFYSLDLIISSTPSIKFYADLLTEEGLPIDLAVIPLMESANNPLARSPKDALGLWQFIPSTAREWGLSTLKGGDDRRNVIKSTRVAIKYLNYLHGQFNDWNLTLAAYNWGMGNVRKALKRGLVKNSKINLQLLPKETAKYLIAFHHLNRVIKFNHANKDFNKFPNRPYLKIIKQNDLQNYFIKNNNLTSSSKVLLHINGYDVEKYSPSNPDILVPTQTFGNYFLSSKIAYKASKRNSGCGNPFYKARRGESIRSLAKKFKVKLSKFHEMNPSVYHLRPGMLVKVCP